MADTDLPSGVDDVTKGGTPAGAEHYNDYGRLRKGFYEAELARLQPACHPS